MRRLAPLVCLLALAAAPVARADDVTPAGGTVSGVAFQDVNNNGVGPENGEGVLAGWIVWADLDGNGVRDPAEPSATAGPDGRYTLGPLNAGAYTLDIQPPDGSACPQGATCTRPVTVTDGATAAVDFPIVPAPPPGQQLLDPEPVRIGVVKLTVPRGCRRKPFAATLAGRGVTRVDFSVDGRVVRSVRAPDKLGRFAARIDPRRVRRGRHKLAAAVWFSRIATSPAKQVTATFRSCAGR